MSLITSSHYQLVEKKMDKKNCFWHKWNKWEDIEVSGNEHIKIRQIKSCICCNKKVGRSVTYVSIVI